MYNSGYRNLNILKYLLSNVPYVFRPSVKQFCNFGGVKLKPDNSACVLPGAARPNIRQRQGLNLHGRLIHMASGLSVGELGSLTDPLPLHFKPTLSIRGRKVQVRGLEFGEEGHQIKSSSILSSVLLYRHPGQ